MITAHSPTYIYDSTPEPALLVEEIEHRIVNEYAMAIASINAEAARIADPKARDALDRVAMRLRAWAEAHRALQAPTSSGEMNLGGYLARVCSALSEASLRNNGVELILIKDEITLAPRRCWRAGLIVAELVANAAKHGFKGRRGMIVVELRLTGPDVQCRVVDNGSPAEKPAPSRGRRIVEQLAQELGGKVDWDFRKSGATVSIEFPLHFDRRPSDTSVTMLRE